MLYRTHHHHHQYIRNPSFFRSSSSNKFPCPPPSTESTTTTFSSAASTSVASLLKGREEEMECLGVNLGAKAAGLLRPEYLGGFVLKRGQYHQQQQLQSQQQQQQGFLMEEILASNGTTNGVSNDDLCLVDEFLNFASEEGQEDVDVSVAAEAASVVFGEESKLEKEEEKFTTISSSPTPPTPQSPKEVKRKEKEEEISDPATTTAVDDFGSVLAVPAEEKDLEWLSHFVEESFSQFSTPYPSGILPRKPSANSKSEPELPETHQFAAPFLTKARRSKRVRAGARVWSFGSCDSAATTTSSSTSSSPNSPPSPPTWEASAPPQTAAFKKPRKSGGWAGSGLGPHASSAPRKCSHCGVQKTPQWRTGPMGAKTLCNACGVRYKSGRLLPEYRPACSPTFSSELHSNNHRKVLEMRRKKETTVVMTTGTGPESGFAPPVPSF